MKYLDNMSEEEIVELNIPTGIPLVYELDDDLKPIRHYYLGDPGRRGSRRGASGRAAKSRESTEQVGACRRDRTKKGRPA